MIHVWDTLIDIPLVFQIGGRYVARIQVIQGAQLQWKRMERRRSFPCLATGFFHIKMADVAGGKINKKEAKTVMQTLRSYTLSMVIFSKMPCKYPQYNVSSVEFSQGGFKTIIQASSAILKT